MEADLHISKPVVLLLSSIWDDSFSHLRYVLPQDIATEQKVRLDHLSRFIQIHCDSTFGVVVVAACSSPSCIARANRMPRGA
jgi:hypothetical protein